MKRMGRWILWLLLIEFLIFFVIGTRIRRGLEAPAVHFVSAPVEAPVVGAPPESAALA